MSENQKRLLQQALDMLEEQTLHIEAPMLPAGEELLNRIRAAISQQAEPADTFTSVDMATASAQGFRDGQAAVEPDGTQDGRAMQLLSELSRTPKDGEKVTRERMAAICEVGHDRAAFVAALTRPAQTEQQPAAVVKENNHCPEGLSDEISEYLPHGTKLYAAPIAQTAQQLDPEALLKVLAEQHTLIERQAGVAGVLLAPQPEQSGLVPEGYALVPITPTEEQWSGLARDLMMWLDMYDKTPQGLFLHLRMLGVEPPQWLRDEPEMQGTGVPSKGTRVSLIYRAMIEDYLSTQRGEE